MKNLLPLFITAILVVRVSAQEPASQPEATIEIDSIGIAHVTIPTIDGRTYFTRVSSDVENWTYLLDIVEGDGTDHCYCFPPTGSKIFVVFEYSDYITQFPETADFDFDGFSNAFELQNNTSPIQHTPGGGIAPLMDPVVPAGSNFVLRKIILDDNAIPKRDVKDYSLDFGFNHTGNSDDNNWPIDFEREDPGVSTSFQLFGQAGGVEAKLSMVERTNRYDDSGKERPLAIPREFSIPKDHDRSEVFRYVSEGATGYIGSISPVEISVTLGISNPLTSPSSKDNLLSYLNSAGSAGDNAKGVWVVPRMIPVLDDQGNPVLDAQGNPVTEIGQFFGVEVASTETPLRRALSGKDKIVVFDGHSNFGIGPNFSTSPRKDLSEFTDFGAGSTDIPIKFVGDGNEDISFINDQIANDVIEWIHGSGGDYPAKHLSESQDLILQQFVEEGYAYVVPDSTVIPNVRNNYNVPFLGFLRYQNLEGKGHGDTFTISPGVGTGRWHMTNWVDSELEKSLIILVDGDRIPNPLRYNTYFYNACSTGRDYIEKFEQKYRGGDFMYTLSACAVGSATHEFVRMKIEGVMTNKQIVADMNVRDLARTNIFTDYGVK